MTFQITRSGTVFSGSAGDLERLRAEFDRQHHILLPEFFQPTLLKVIQRQIERADFDRKVHEDHGEIVASETYMRDPDTLGLLEFLVNDQRLFEVVQEITGCDRIGVFGGRVYRNVPGRGHHFSWHSDLSDHRMIAMSVNFSAQVYHGGFLQIRDRSSKQILSEVSNIGFGDAIIFRLAAHLEHRVTELKGDVPKTSFAGWYHSSPNFQSLLRKRHSEQRMRPSDEISEIRDRGTPLSGEGLKKVQKVTLEDRVKSNQEVVYRTAGENTELLNWKTGDYYTLDRLGSRLWSLLGEHGKLQKVIEIMKMEYDVTPTILQQDILHLVQELCTAGLVHIPASPILR